MSLVSCFQTSQKGSCWGKHLPPARDNEIFFFMLCCRLIGLLLNKAWRGSERCIQHLGCEDHGTAMLATYLQVLPHTANTATKGSVFFCGWHRSNPVGRLKGELSSGHFTHHPLFSSGFGNPSTHLPIQDNLPPPQTAHRGEQFPSAP